VKFDGGYPDIPIYASLAETLANATTPFDLHPEIRYLYLTFGTYLPRLVNDRRNGVL
jgi:hypothetical protein